MSNNATTLDEGKSTVRTAIFDFCRSVGMTTIFGNPGTTELPMFHDFPADFQYVLGLQEAVVVGMADGFAQANNNAALVNLHSAAGVGHGMGNIFTAFKNQTPMVIIAGQQARSLMPFEAFLHAMEATEMPKPYVKWSCEPARPEDVPAAIARAYHMAMQYPQGPTFVSVPMDDWDQPAEPIVPRQVFNRRAPDAAFVKMLGQALDDSKRPALVVGAGVDRDNAWDEIIALAERYQARVWVSPVSSRCSFPENHPLFAGFLMPYRERIVETLAAHDLALVVGAPTFTYHAVGEGPHIGEGTRLFQITDNPSVVAYSPAGDATVCTVREGLSALLERKASAARAEVRERRATAPRVEPGERITSEFVMQTVADLRPADSIIVEEAPSSRVAMQNHLPITSPQGFFTMASGGLGHSMPAAVGIALAIAGKRRVIGIFGDGSSMYAVQAMWSAAQLDLPIIMIIVNNQGYAALENYAAHFGMPAPLGTKVPGLDFAGLGKAQGCRGVLVKTPDQLVAALKDSLRSDAPVVIDVIVDDRRKA